MQNTVFLVNNEPYCLWDEDLSARNSEFLRGLDPDFFDYATKSHLETEDEKRASVSLRLGLHHALETFFSLIGAYVQAPRCPYAWLAKCNTPALREVVSRIQSNDPTLRTLLTAPTASWEAVSQSVHTTLMPGTEKHARAVDGFATLWKRLAQEFLDPHHIDEYNSLKHGFRVGTGGFRLEFAAEPSDGSPPAPDAFKLLGHSAFGSSHFKVSPLTDKPGERSLTVSRQSNNWSIERMVLLNQATHMSINNVVAALRVAHGLPAGECRFLHPTDPEDFLRPWKYSPGVTNMHWNSVANESTCRSLSKQELVKFLSSSTNG